MAQTSTIFASSCVHSLLDKCRVESGQVRASVVARTTERDNFLFPLANSSLAMYSCFKKKGDGVKAVNSREACTTERNHMAW